MTGQASGCRVRLASPATAVALGAVILVLIALTFPVAGLAGMTASAGGGSLIFVPVFGTLGFVVAWRKPGTRLAGCCSVPSGFSPSAA